MTIDHTRIINHLGQLVALPSVSSHDPQLDCSNRGVAELIADWLEDSGFAIEWMPVDRGLDKVNLLATLGTGEPGLVLSGHTDTVACDERGWSSDPFTLTERDGRLYGLGAADMKAFFALMVEAVRQLDSGALRRPLMVLATADEETSMAGVKALASSGRLKARHALIGEPTGLKPVRMHKGVMMEAIRVQGQSGHASEPESGRSALEGMQKVMTALLEWRAELTKRYRNPLFTVQVPTMNLGHIHGGTSSNKICAECELHVDIRILPEMDASTVRTEMRELIHTALAGTGLQSGMVSLFDGVPSLHVDADAEIIRVAEVLSGASAGSVAYGTEAPWFQQMGLQPVILGAGDIAVAHQPDEFVPLAHFEPMARMLRGFIDHFCVK